MDMCIE